MPHNRNAPFAAQPWWPHYHAHPSPPPVRRRFPPLRGSPNPDLPPSARFTARHWSQRTFVDELKHRDGQLPLGLKP